MFSLSKQRVRKRTFCFARCREDKSPQETGQNKFGKGIGIDMQIRPLSELEGKIQYHFKKIELLEEATTHSSYSNERKINKTGNYERLEFLGDAVLELTTSEFLFAKKPQMPEGKMTKTRASIVCEQSLAYCARELGLGEYIRFGKGEESTGGRNRDSIIADVVEAVIGAIYVDCGFEEAKRFIYQFVLSDLEDKQLFYDAKTILQEHVQQRGLGALEYELIGESGPEHDKCFVVEARLEGKKIGEGSGKTKKAAQQQAAYQALLAFRKENGDLCI